MLDSAKSLGEKVLSLNPLRKPPILSEKDVQDARNYISGYWKRLERYNPKDQESLIGLPNTYLVPSFQEGSEFDYNELYYWDSYFMIQGFLSSPSEQKKKLVLGILDDLIALFERFGIIPNGSQLYYVSRSHPPFLSSFIFDVYNAYGMDKKWLRQKITVAKEEYETVWMGTRKPHARQVYRGLSRYYDFNYLHDIAETESGWDMTPRFGRKALNYLPVDLNSLLYKYEMDFSRAAQIFNNADEVAKWENAARRRKNAMNELMWDKIRGFYYDYNFVKEKRGNVSSLAGFYPMWAGLVSEKKANQMVRALRRFENRGGLATTDAQLNQLIPGGLPMQWAYPNGWAPLQFLVIKGLQRYGYNEDAERIARKWLKINLDWFNRNGVFLEKYNVVQVDKPPAKGVYPSQTGFGWTNAIFERFCQEFIDK